MPFYQYPQKSCLLSSQLCEMSNSLSILLAGNLLKYNSIFRRRKNKCTHNTTILLMSKNIFKVFFFIFHFLKTMCQVNVKSLCTGKNNFAASVVEQPIHIFSILVFSLTLPYLIYGGLKNPSAPQEFHQRNEYQPEHNFLKKCLDSQHGFRQCYCIPSLGDFFLTKKFQGTT